MTLTLSVLDQSPIREGGTAADAIGESLALAGLCDRLGYRRYWVAEHHNADGLAGSAPEILIGRIAGLTQHIRVGAGGVMLSHYSAYKVAESFRMLETLFPGRIDLGLGRAPGSDQHTAYALAPPGGVPSVEHYPAQVADLIAYVTDHLAPEHPFAGLKAQPLGPSAPEIWLLGSSDQSAALAAHLGCAFSFAHFISDRLGPEIMAAYREAYQPSAIAPKPRGAIGVFVICADTEAEAERLSLSRDLWRLRLDRGYLGPYPSIETARAHDYSEHDRTIIHSNRRRQVVGSPEQCRDRLIELAARYGVPEIVVVTITFDFKTRQRSYELLAQAFNLQPKPQ
ncbi:MAG: LLM class flavin-dependent oxidoreductase [Alphaproteobacteria bacterium]|nr:LLM class flavin-dependent oxidoreductase [Alphaproteobacteria bacterium]